MRRDGKSLGQMAKEEIGPATGMLAMVAILAIMVILLAVLGLVVVRALEHSPWGVFTILCTVPDALREARLREREGEIGPWERQWHEAEDWYFAEAATEAGFDLVLDLS